jgi:carboxymethylenebutenolidase
MPEGPTSGGDARAFVFTPPDTGDGPWPAAILYMDAPAIRPAMFEMGAFFAELRASTDAARAMADTGVWLDWLAKPPQARPGKVGVTGYCMGDGVLK